MTEGRARPRLLVLSSTYPRWQDDPEPGFVHELSRRLTGAFEVTVLAPHAPGAAGRESMDGVQVVRFRYAPQQMETLVNDGGIATNLKRQPWKWLLVPGFVTMQLIATLRWLRRHQADVVHAHWIIPQGVATALLLPFVRRAPLVITSHGADLFAFRGRLPELAKRYALARAAFVTVVSPVMAHEATRLGAPPERVTVMSMGVDMSRFVPDRGVRGDHGILFVGRLVEKKGVSLLIAAMPLVLARHPAATLTIAGFGPLLDQLREQVRQLGVNQAVTFLGAVPQKSLPRLYQEAAVFVAPFVQAAGGDQEGLGLVAVEAAACGASVIVGAVPATAGFENESGFTRVDARDTPRLAEAILERLGERGREKRLTADRERLARKFDWNSVAEAYRRLLARVAAGRSHGEAFSGGS